MGEELERIGELSVRIKTLYGEFEAYVSDCETALEDGEWRLSFVKADFQFWTDMPPKELAKLARLLRHALECGGYCEHATELDAVDYCSECVAESDGWKLMNQRPQHGDQ